MTSEMLVASAIRQRGSTDSHNVATFLPAIAGAAPDRPAIVVDGTSQRAARRCPDRLTFAELEALSNKYANGLANIGMEKGMRALVMVPPGIEFVGLIFALFKSGIVPVLIDPGMGLRRLLECVQMVDIHALIGVPKAHLLRLIRARAFHGLRHAVVVGPKRAPGARTLHEISQGVGDSLVAVDSTSDEPAAILFTSGSTGPAKGVVYEHGMFMAQVRLLQSYYGIEEGEVDLPGLPLFALFGPALGMTCVFPVMDPSRPARVDPARFVESIRTHEVTNSFGSPAIWRRVAAYCVERRIFLPSLRRILIAGASVPPAVIEQLHQSLNEEADVHTPYGATEALPVSSISGRELLRDCQAKTREGAGTCVGRPLPEIDAKIIRLCDEPVPGWSKDLLVADGEVGEIAVSGPVVTRAYFGLSEATRRAKIYDGNRVWHRMGDLGYRDTGGRIWFCGRKSQRVCTGEGVLLTDPCEAVFGQHPSVCRAALVGIGPNERQRPVIVVEPDGGRVPSRSRARRLCTELLRIGQANPKTQSINTILFHRSLPVDVRHNAKINREALARWAARKLR